MANEDLANAARQLGIALIAPQGLDGRWSFPGIGAPKRDELAYVEAVAADAVSRFGLDPNRLLASGFSLGGSMVWYLACRMPARFAAFAPIAGAALIWHFPAMAFTLVLLSEFAERVLFFQAVVALKMPGLPQARNRH